METLIKIFVLLISVQLSGQTVNLHIPKQKFEVKGIQYAGLGLMFIGGIADGYNQVVRHHYYRMQEIHPNINDNFWGADQWKNKWELDANGDLIPNGEGWAVSKYKEKFWGSSRWFVSVTDAHHLTREVDRWTTISGSMMLTIGEKKPFSHYAKLFALGLLARSTGFALIHDVIYK